MRKRLLRSRSGEGLSHGHRCDPLPAHALFMVIAEYFRVNITKRIILIAAGVLLCAALVVGIVSRLAAVPMPIDPAIPDDSAGHERSGCEHQRSRGKGGYQRQMEITMIPAGMLTAPAQSRPFRGTPTKPDAPEHPGKMEKDHAADDVPDADRNKETPPTYKPEQTEVKPQPTEPAGGSTNDAGQVYVPGFGYVTPSGPNDGGTLDDMYENGNKIGIMGG